MKKTKGLHELYNKDPITADKFVWGRESDPISRRGFLRKAGLASMSLALGSSIPFAKQLFHKVMTHFNCMEKMTLYY